MAGEPREIRGFFRILFTFEETGQEPKKRSAGEVREMMLRHAKTSNGVQRRLYGNPGNAEACGLVHNGISEFCQVAE